MKLTVCLVMVVVISSPTAIAQTPAGQKIGLIQYIQASHGGITRDLIAAAERMPEADYGFKPSPMTEARTYGAVIGHAADGMYAGCAKAQGVPNPAQDIEKTLARKADILKALKDAIAFCEGAFSALTEQSVGRVRAARTGRDPTHCCFDRPTGPQRGDVRHQHRVSAGDESRASGQ